MWEQERRAQKRAQQVQEMGQYDHGGYLLRVIASKAKPATVSPYPALVNFIPANFLGRPGYWQMPEQ